ncbi:MAG: HPr family phosphocarrier protein [Nevskia sp.]|jgi:phosphocarrier protein HPr|nr:HPr family phosphocarrier protein [Gammaproteobacteria bacterium]MDH4458142.1 HPr family phosphocarrier protein [Nevskia sp.]
MTESPPNTPAAAQTAEKTVVIINRLGLHARAASKFVTLASSYEAELTVEKDGKQVPGKSILKVMMLAAAQGTVLKLAASGPDAVEALEALAALVANRFDEDA